MAAGNKSIAHYEHIFNTLDAIIIESDAKFRVTAFNKKAEKVYGYRKEELLGKYWPNYLLPKELRKTIPALILKNAKKGINANENLILTKGGETRLFSWLNTYSFEGNRFVGITSIGIDVSKQKEAEENLRKINEELHEYKNHLERLVEHRTQELDASYERYKLLFEQAPSAIFVGDRNGVITSVNKAAEELLDRKREKIIGKRLTDFATPESVEKMESALRKRVAGNKPTGYEVQLRRPNGEIRVAEPYSSVIREGGKVVGLQAILRDVTGLKETREKYTTLLETAPDAIMTGDNDGVITTANQQAEILFGRRKDEFVGKKLWNFLTRESTEKMIKMQERARKTGAPMEDLEIQVVRPSGEIRDVELKGSVLRLGNRAVGAQGVFRDITGWKKEQEKKEEQLRQLEEFKEFAVHRELEMVRLKKRIAELEEQRKRGA